MSDESPNFRFGHHPAGGESVVSLVDGAHDLRMEDHVALYQTFSVLPVL